MSHSRFFALTPDEAFTQRVLDEKAVVERLVGPQLYLHDPPHLTLFLAAFDETINLEPAIATIVKTTPMVQAECTGWHVFANDVLTGNQTLVHDFREPDRQHLRLLQHKLVHVLAPQRDLVATLARFDKSWSRFSTPYQANIMRFGFPFLGEGWHPHVTVASIQPKDWPMVWAELEQAPYMGPVTFPVLHEYELVDGKPVERAEHHFLASRGPLA